jgi:ribosomal protein S18 acetylase RimI-like enzyme
LSVEARVVEVRPVAGRLGRRQFVDLPFRLYKDDPHWIPPLRLSVYDRLSPKHPSQKTQDTRLWMAWRGREPVGRIGACIDYAFDRVQNEKWCWIGFFECIDDQEVADALFDAAVGWGRAKGAETCTGPASFTLNDECGLLVENFEDPPLILTTENPRYYERLWTTAGWTQAMDLWAWKFTRVSAGLSDRQRAVLERLATRSKVTVREARMKDFDAEVDRLFEVYNAAWSENWGFAPLAEDEVKHLAKQVKQIVDPNLVLIAENEKGEPVGVTICLPDANEPMKKVRSGRLLPFGWYHVLTGMKKPRQARVWALGVRPDYQVRALGPLMYSRMLDNLSAIPTMESAEASWILATNDRMNGAIEALGGTRYKTWRLFQRPTSGENLAASSPS